MKIVTWNVNSIHARLDQLLDWIDANRPDVVLLQETKCTDQAFPIDAIGDAGYDAVFHGQRTYNGVAILSRDEPSNVVCGFPGEQGEARLIQADINGVTVLSVYVPNGQEIGSAPFAYKLTFLDSLRAHLLDLGVPARPLVIAGDFNIAPNDLDVWDPLAMQGKTHVSSEERTRLLKLMSIGLFDVFRNTHPGEQAFSWWDYRALAFEKNAGLRIDLHLVTEPILRRTKATWIDVDARKQAKTSDHAPVVLELVDAKTGSCK